MKALFALPALWLALGTACSLLPGHKDDPTASTADPAASGDDDDGGGGGGGASSSAPVILSLSTNTDQITEGDVIRITAVVTDPDGIDDLIGGELLAESGSSYGAFATAAQEGSYQIVVSWDELDAVVPIAFQGRATRDVMARFYDVAGHQVQQMVSFDLTCPDTGVACDGVCADLDNDPDHCGACGHDCSHVGGALGSCDAGSCVVDSGCTLIGNGDSCADACMAAGFGSCVVVGGSAGTYYWDHACSSVGGWLDTCSEVIHTDGGAGTLGVSCTCRE